MAFIAVCLYINHTMHTSHNQGSNLARAYSKYKAVQNISEMPSCFVVVPGYWTASSFW